MSIPTANNLWLEAGAMQGGSRNQLEMTDELAQFFGNQARSAQSVTILIPAGTQHDCSFVYRGDDYEHYSERWRLSLPTEHMGAPPCPGRVIRFSKQQSGGVLVIRLEVTDVNSPDHTQWQQQSHPPGGGSGTTHGGRQYGWWS